MVELNFAHSFLLSDSNGFLEVLAQQIKGHQQPACELVSLPVEHLIFFPRDLPLKFLPFFLGLTWHAVQNALVHDVVAQFVGNGKSQPTFAVRIHQEIVIHGNEFPSACHRCIDVGLFT